MALLALASLDALAQQVPISRHARFTGNVNFVATGGSLRTQADTGNSCLVSGASNRQLSGIPNGATIVAAYLYWGGSGSNPDTQVRLNGAVVTADRVFQAVYPYSPNLPFFGGFADVTNRVTGNGNYTFSDLTVNTGEPHCTPSAVLAGWGLVAIYGSPTERLRAINVFDGLQYFRGSQLVLTPNGFRIPATNIDGRVAVITWEGDPGNSDPLDGFSESLRFNGTLLDDGLTPPGSSPTTQQFDGTVNSQGATNSYGADIDTYDVSSLLTPGATSATTTYSAGGDLVLLTAQIVSVTSEPMVDLSITKTHTGNFTVGSTGAFTLTVSSATGSQQTDFPIVVTDTLPAGLTYSSASGTGWACGAVAQTLTCTHPGPLAANASLPPVTLNVVVGNAAYPSVTNTAAVTTPSNDPEPTNNAASDTVTVTGSNLSTSTKSVVDLNGGDADPGDTLRYTITLIETAGIAATGVSVIDHIPGNTSGFTVTSVPPGATDASTGNGTGANGRGLLSINNISVPANGSVTIQFEVQIAAGMPPGATIANTATVNNPAGSGATPAASDVVVSASQIPGKGTKQLYLRSDMGQALYRTPPTSNQSAVSVTGTEVWTLAPLQAPVTLESGPMALHLLASRIGTFLTNNRTISVTFANSALGTLVQVNNVSLNNVPTSPTLYTIGLNLPAQVTAPAGSRFTLTIHYNSFLGLGVNIWPYSNGNTSRIELNSLSVINVASVQAFNAAYPGGGTTGTFNRGATAYIRAVVSDPFGSYDINGASLEIVDPNGVSVASNLAMTQVADSGAATRTYQYAYPVPADAAAGIWTARVTAREGTENMVDDDGVGTFVIAVPALSIQKTSIVVSDPVNGTTSPKRIPGAVLRYSILVANTGPGAIDAGSLVITDPLPLDVELCVAVACGGSLAFANGSTPSGLTFVYANHVRYSSTPTGGAPYTYSPVATPQGYDANIRGIRIAPAGALNGASGSNHPSFTLQFFVRVR